MCAMGSGEKREIRGSSSSYCTCDGVWDLTLSFQWNGYIYRPDNVHWSWIMLISIDPDKIYQCWRIPFQTISASHRTSFKNRSDYSRRRTSFPICLPCQMYSIASSAFSNGSTESIISSNLICVAVNAEQRSSISCFDPALTPLGHFTLALVQLQLSIRNSPTSILLVYQSEQAAVRLTG